MITCAHDGAALLRVERIRDYAALRRRAVFACGHSEIEPGTAIASHPLGERVCRHCGQAFHRAGSILARVCDGCRR